MRHLLNFTVNYRVEAEGDESGEADSETVQVTEDLVIMLKCLPIIS